MQQHVSWTHHYAGDRAVVLEFGQRIEREIVDRIVALDRQISSALQDGRLTGITETIPTFRSLAIMYDPLLAHPDELLEELRALDDTRINDVCITARKWLLPVHYGGESGPDLADVSQLTGLPEADVISLHQGCKFTVYMLGFLPGFAFLGDTPAALHLPRRSEPRVRVPAGSVAIAMQLTGVYPWESPGGWHILGNCPVALFDAQLDPPALFKAGDSVSFKSIDSDEHETIVREVSTGTFDRRSLLLSTPQPSTDSSESEQTIGNDSSDHSDK